MRSKILVRILIVLLAAFLIFRIHQRVETYRVPRDMCRSQVSVLAEANIHHMFEQEGIPAPDLDSLLTYSRSSGYFETAMGADSITVTFGDDLSRQVLIPDQWKDLWNENAIQSIQSSLSDLREQHSAVGNEIASAESELGYSLDSLISLREIYILENPEEEEGAGEDDEEVLTPGEYFDDSVGFSAQELIDQESSLASSVDSVTAVLQNFNDVIAPARRDSVAATVMAVCPSLWEDGYFDSLYSYDPKLALGTQFSISCPNIDRHGGVVGGFVEKDFPDSVFLEPDWAETQLVYRFPEYAQMRRLQASRANLVRAAEEEAAYLAQRYPMIVAPKDPQNLEVDIDALIDPLGGEYVFELQPDTTYTFYENPEGRTALARGDSVTVETVKFIGYTTADPDTSRVEVFFSHPMTFPSRADGADPDNSDQVTLIMYWERSESGSLRIDERDIDLIDAPTWEFISSHYGSRDTTVTE
ncbi:MAG: hypothetical protein AVO35_10455 [Candidatus Aegiribacteria sp. MLS_C]|nr:MAG: hypothetical protein AVO35_10455 [Candidatus Aegiribacteria sp. MLS_C]